MHGWRGSSTSCDGCTSQGGLAVRAVEVDKSGGGPGIMIPCREMGKRYTPRGGDLYIYSHIGLVYKEHEYNTNMTIHTSNNKIELYISGVSNRNVFNQSL